MFFKPVYILILAVTIVIDYCAGLLLEREQSLPKKKYILLLSIIANVGFLGIFKYFNFFNHNISGLLSVFGYANAIPYLNILLPIGLSFHTFQAMSYTIEVYRGNQKAERHFGIYALYVMFYPQLVAGPIERPQNMLHQFHERKYIDYQRIADGLKLMAWGMFKKVVIADRLSVMVDYVYDQPKHFQGIPLLLATLFFSFQIFCDFSGYSDIALGSAKVMGYDLMVNFRRPYFSASISEFWKRWHISLSTWFRDYLYIPLGGNRVIKWRWYYNLLLVFIISGFWHGASWNFVIWGALHGIYLIVGIMTENTRSKFNRVIGLTKFPWLLGTLKITTTFILVSFAWIFFRAENLSDALYIIKNIPLGWGRGIHDIISDSLVAFHTRTDILYLGADFSWFITGICFILFMEIVHMIEERRKDNVVNILRAYPAPIRMTLYSCFLVVVVFFGIFSRNQFIYFQF